MWRHVGILTSRITAMRQTWPWIDQSKTRILFFAILGIFLLDFVKFLVYRTRWSKIIPFPCKIRQLTVPWQFVLKIKIFVPTFLPLIIIYVLDLGNSAISFHDDDDEIFFLKTRILDFFYDLRKINWWGLKYRMTSSTSVEIVIVHDSYLSDIFKHFFFCGEIFSCFGNAALLTSNFFCSWQYNTFHSSQP